MKAHLIPGAIFAGFAALLFWGAAIIAALFGHPEVVRFCLAFGLVYAGPAVAWTVGALLISRFRKR